MALTDENGGNGMVMPVAPMGYGNSGNFGGYTMPVMPMMGNYGGGFGGFGGDWSALIILFIFAAMFGGGWGGFGGINGFGGGLGIDFPWLLNGQQGINANTNAGFNQASTQSQLSGIQTSINTGFSNAEVAACNRAMTDQALSFNNQIADLNRSFDAQTAITAGQTALQSQLAQCCCDNRLATANLSALVQAENCADREALSNGLRDVITAQTAGTQRILDKLCDQELQAERRENQELRSRLNMADLAASQAAQTAALVADNTAQTQYLVNRIAPYPVPAVPFNGFYGWNNWGNWNNGCGCGNNFGGFNGNF